VFMDRSVAYPIDVIAHPRSTPLMVRVEGCRGGGGGGMIGGDGNVVLKARACAGAGEGQREAVEDSAVGVFCRCKIGHERAGGV
jgi:hypothetical protein